jgi:hypothetical protein
MGHGALPDRVNDIFASRADRRQSTVRIVATLGSLLITDSDAQDYDIGVFSYLPKLNCVKHSVIG